ncbi:MAG: glycosyltransferase family 2 protein [Pyrinomonadaceae bacterium]|nr:glycosyltransferase family 2 protein [Pyrinomonadaceae bacterium]
MRLAASSLGSMLVYYFFAAIVIWLGIVSVRGGKRFADYLRLDTARPLPDFTPFVSVIAPTRGLDQGLHENLAALFQQEYPNYEIIFVTDEESDPSLAVIEEVKRSFASAPLDSDRRNISSRVVIAGPADDSGQKVHNLRVAVGEIDSRSEVLVFVDADARPQVHWLRSLVAPLHDQRFGAATGYRWFIPLHGGLASHLCSVWNASIVSALGENESQNFCWGGSTAIRRETFEHLNIVERWRGTVSDDFALTNALKEADLPIHFVPACLTVSLEDCTFGELVEFTTRQVKITRVYASHLWKAALIGSLLFVSVFFGGLVLVVARALLGLSFWLPLLLLCLIGILGAIKGFIRLRAVQLPLAKYGSELSATRPAHMLLWPIASALFLYNCMAAMFSRRIEWRGIKYELKSPNEAVIIRKY